MTQPDESSASEILFLACVALAAWMALLGLLPRLVRWMLSGWWRGGG